MSASRGRPVGSPYSVFVMSLRGGHLTDEAICIPKVSGLLRLAFGGLAMT